MASDLHGWTGRILQVDLASGRTWIEEDDSRQRKYLGGKGLNHCLAWDEIQPGVGTFDPENRLLISVGPLTGTPAPTSGRATVGGVAAQSRPEMYSHSGVGGWFPPSIKWAGFDAVVIKGRSDKPCYLHLHDNQAEVIDAGSLWGLGTYETQQALKNRHGNSAHSLCIGPAGENLSRIACMLTDTENAAGQGGFGGVAGSKNLKAICAQGNQPVTVADPERLLALRREHSGPPAKNPQQDNGDWDYDGYPVHNVSYRRHHTACSHACDKPCFWRFHDVPKATGRGLRSGQLGCVGSYTIGWQRLFGIEWPLWWQGLEAGFEITGVLNDLGLNEWELLAGMAPWLVMGYRSGVITKKDFGDLCPVDADNPFWWLRLSHAIAYRQGMGDLLAEGVSRAIEELGPEVFADTIYQDGKKVPTKISLQEAWGYAGHDSGRAIHSQVPFPDYLIAALAWMTASRDPIDDTHIKAHNQWWEAFRKDPYGSEMGARIAIWNEHRSELKSSLTLCEFAFPNLEHTDLESNLFSAVTGLETSEAELDLIGERLKNLQRAILVRNHGRKRVQEVDEVLAWYTRPDGNTGTEVDPVLFNHLVDTYYRLRGWDTLTGWPSVRKLIELGLDEVAADLAAAGLAPPR